MNKRAHDEWTDRRMLQENGWPVRQHDSVAFNGGTESESIEHYLTKALVAYVLKGRGWRIDSEVEGPTGEVDILAYGGEGAPFCVEIETDATREVILDKVDRYVTGQPLRECFVVAPEELPVDVDPALEWIEGEL